VVAPTRACGCARELSVLLGSCMYPPPPHKRVKVFEVETLGLDFGVDPGLCGNRKAPAGGRGLISISIIADGGVPLGQGHLIDCRWDRLFLGLTWVLAARVLTYLTNQQVG
jgi:hypothetical protein